MAEILRERLAEDQSRLSNLDVKDIRVLVTSLVTRIEKVVIRNPNRGSSTDRQCLPSNVGRIGNRENTSIFLEGDRGDMHFRTIPGHIGMRPLHPSDTSSI